MTLEAGTRLGHYRVVSSLGAGGMGEVYRAKDTKLGREVAIKVLPAGFADDAERMARFEREAKLLASLNHRNIATLYGYEVANTGSDDEQRFLVMEVVEGETLADRIKRGAIALDEALPLFLQIAEGLEAAHENGVIHRDLKPANIKVTEGGEVKILDFGLAKAMAPEVDHDEDVSQSPTLTLAATQRGEILGTAAYMSPEQATGKAVDARTDVWAFGVCLFEALAGIRPFEAGNAPNTLAAVLRDEIAWERLPESTPPTIVRLLHRCLERERRRRLQHIGDARIEVEDASSTPKGDEVSTLDVAEKGGILRLVAAALVVGAVMGALAVWTLKPAPAAPERPGVRSVLSAAPSGPVQIASPFDRDVAVTPDGRAVVYRSGTSLYVRPLDRLGGSELDGTGAASAPFISPDGAWVGFESDSRLKKVSILGGPTVTLCELPDTLAGASWSADDTIIFGTINGGLYRVSGGGGEPELVVAPDSDSVERSYRFPDVLPGGEAVLFSVFDTVSNVEQARIMVLSLATGERNMLVPGGAGVRYVPTGHLVYGVNGTLRAVAFDIETLEVRGNPTPLLEGLSTTSFGATNFDFSRDGSLVYVSGAQGGGAATLVWVDRKGGEEALAAPLRAYAYPRISPDGRRVAVSSDDEGQDVWIWDLGRETLDRLTRTPGEDLYSIWTPDGREVVFGSDRGGPADLYLKSADGTGAARRLTETTEQLFPSSISPDGRLLVYRVGSAPPWDLGVVSVDGEEAPHSLLASEFDERNGEISPDGRWLAYESDESGESRIYVRPFPDVEGGRFPISAVFGSEPAWSPNGRELFYRTRDGLVAVPIRTEPVFEAGSPELLFTATNFSQRAGRMYDITPDGQRFLLVKQAGAGEGTVGTQVILVENWFEELARLVPTD